MQTSRGSLSLALALGFAFMLSTAGHAADTEFDFANQHNWFTHTGFYLDVANSIPDPADGQPNKAPIPLTTAKLELHVADGQDWHIISATADWKYDHDYTVDAFIDGKSASLILDGNQVAGATVRYQPSTEAPLIANSVPHWLPTPTEYYVDEHTLVLTDGGRARTVRIPHLNQANLPLLLFAGPGQIRIDDWQSTGKPTHVHTTFRFIHAPDVKASSPMVDAYGQSMYGDWPTKVHSDTDLRADITKEDRRLRKWGIPSGYDSYGGRTNLGWRETGSGFYRTEKHNGYWWLIDPDGYPSYFIAMCTVNAVEPEGTPVTGREYLYSWLPPKTSDWDGAWAKDIWHNTTGVDFLRFPNSNMIRKYGLGWKQTSSDIAVKRLRTWGFSGVGKWSGQFSKVPYFLVLGHWSVPNTAGHPDIFDPQVADKLRTVLTTEIKPDAADPYLVGWSVGNEYEEIISQDNIRAILKMAATVPVKRAIIDYALDTIYKSDIGKLMSAWGINGINSRDLLYASTPTPPTADIEQMRHFDADKYYAFLHDIVKAADPNHLYFGCWIDLYDWENDSDWDLEAAHDDVIGYDSYLPTFARPEVTGWFRRTDKPVFCGEFGYPPAYTGQRGFGAFGPWTADDKETARKYAAYIDDAERNPYSVGVSWFEYRDQPITGRGLDWDLGPVTWGEHFAHGTLDVADQPKWDLVDQMRKSNLAAVDVRNGLR